MSERLRVAVVGLGIGMSHLVAFRELPELFEIAAVCDPVTKKIELAKRFFDVPAGFESFDELLAQDGIDVIDVCTPPGMHVPMVKRILESGRDAICEKPLAASLAEVDELAEAERSTGRRLMPISQYRFGRGLERLRRLLAADLAGRPYVASVETYWRRDAAYYAVEWRGRFDTELGGVCMSHAIHSHDLIISLLGPVKRVFAHTATRVNDIETEDCAVATVEFQSGAMATLTATLGSVREFSRLRLAFENFSAESSSSPYEPGAEPWTFEPATQQAAKAIEATLADVEPGPELFAGQFAGYHAAVTQNKALPVRVSDARAALELVTAIYHSSRTGMPVELPIGPDHPLYEGWLPEPNT